MWSTSAFWPSLPVGKASQPNSVCQFAPCVNSCFPGWGKRWNVLCFRLLIHHSSNESSVKRAGMPGWHHSLLSETCYFSPPWNLTTGVFLLSCISLPQEIAGCMCRSIPRACQRLASLAHSWHVFKWGSKVLQVKDFFSLLQQAGKILYWLSLINLLIFLLHYTW